MRISDWSSDVCSSDLGALVILGLFTRLAVIPLIITMIVALISTKLPILLGHDVGIFPMPDIKRVRFRTAQHHARADIHMLPGCISLHLVGAGPWSLEQPLFACPQISI